MESTCIYSLYVQWLEEPDLHIPQPSQWNCCLSVSSNSRHIKQQYNPNLVPQLQQVLFTYNNTTEINQTVCLSSQSSNCCIYTTHNITVRQEIFYMQHVYFYSIICPQISSQEQSTVATAAHIIPVKCCQLLETKFRQRHASVNILATHNQTWTPHHIQLVNFLGLINNLCWHGNKSSRCTHALTSLKVSDALAPSLGLLEDTRSSGAARKQFFLFRQGPKNWTLSENLTSWQHSKWLLRR